MQHLANFLNVKFRTIKYIVLLLFFLLSLATAVSSIDSFIAYSSLPVGLTKAIMGILVLSLIDDVVFSKVDTNTEIQNKNIAYALVYLANALIIAACIAAA